MEQRYGTDPSRRYGTGVWNGGMERVWSRSLFRTSYFDLLPYMYNLIYIYIYIYIHNMTMGKILLHHGYPGDPGERPNNSDSWMFHPPEFVEDQMF